MKQISVDALHRMVENKEDVTIIDVRSQDHYNQGHVPGAVSMPLSTLESQIDQFDPSNTYHVICQSGISSLKATQLLTEKGFDAVNVKEGTLDYPGQLEQ